MENEQIAELQKKIDALTATVNRQHSEHLSWLNQMLQQQNNMLAAQVDSLRKEQQSVRRAIGLTDDKMPFEPYYSPHFPLSSHEPTIYNKYGERLQLMFLLETENAHSPYGGEGICISIDTTML